MTWIPQINLERGGSIAKYYCLRMHHLLGLLIIGSSVLLSITLVSGTEPKMMKDISDANFDEHAAAVKSGSESAKDTSSTSINNINIKSKSSFTNTSKEDSHPSPLIAIVNEFLGSYYDDNVLYSSIWEGEDTIARASYEQVSSVSIATSSTMISNFSPPHGSNKLPDLET